ncbi:MAG: 4-(cytidine 5'-diphospho)-2-C-methyl-D-erythritol kinase [Actinobacteria bacterium]|nr:4-(cytidine 5'-diphospho)-2-C-methyl-D-erythritol kinase [Actinomycetota bacterium]
MTEGPAEGLVTDAIRVRAHPKLTLTLRVLGRREDGFHEVEGLVASVDVPSDIIEVALRGVPETTLEVAGLADGVPSDGTNLAARAAELLLRSLPPPRREPDAGARLSVKKGIPAGAGLGGGSADAAAVLHAVAGLLPDEAAGIDLLEVAAELGSDVPFCTVGGLAWMRGRGELLESLAPVRGWSAVVAVPSFALATAEVYAAWDALGGPRGEPVPVPAALADLAPELVNDLEPAALHVEPRLAEFRDRFHLSSGRRPLLAGSGSAYFVLFDDVEDAARGVAEGMAEHAALVVVARPVDGGVTPIAG